ncbi:hypothetical protein GcM3_188021 [Golovinomyces cichoracearum]|uniref:Uncharacterized protein n=1 Tax=Golovinomyces cichoracearum TaxID=62708 RepID=A0A420HIW1_9PEZI|nr:hypothetical protein GcM3_188021 [Golovinomyces cichoracearum]
MDILEEYISHTFRLYTIAKPFLDTFQKSLSSLLKQLEPVLISRIETIAQYASVSPSILTICLLVLLLLVMLKVVNFLRSLIAFWLRLMIRTIFWSTVVTIFAIVWQRGFERSLRELGAWVREIVNVYSREYERWEGYGNQPGYKTNYGPRIRENKYGHKWR